jgi:excisionase family DNA binding protein
MAKMMDDGEFFLSPQEASSILNVSYKTLQRWAENGERQVWVKEEKRRVKKKLPVEIDIRTTNAGHRLYSLSSIQHLSEVLKSSRTSP